jgi:TonB-dependent starch-binding outer membrane protein SusC
MNYKQLIKKVSKCFFAFALTMNLFMSYDMFAQQEPTSGISGVVVDEAGVSLPGVNIIEKGTKNAVSTNAEGKFNFNVSNPNAILIISYIGYQQQQINLSGRTDLKVKLTSDSQALQEVVVVGYTKVKKTDLTGSVGSLSAKDLTERNLTNPIEAMQGAVAGVQISNATGRLGDDFKIIIRGKNSMNPDSKPLYVVDGAPSDNIDFLNPQDIARIDILKDASSTAIYGSRGSNGVVIVTTKSGATVKSSMTVTYDSYLGQKDVARLPKMMDGATWWQYHQAAFLPTAAKDPITNVVTPATLSTAVLGTANSLLLERVTNNNTFDWYKAVLKKGTQQNHYLSISGRTDGGISYNLGFGLQKETGNISNESLDKTSFKLGLNHKINDKFSTGANITLARTAEEQGSAVAMQEAFRLNPFLFPYDENGDLVPLPGKVKNAAGVTVIDKTSTYNPLLEIANSSDATKSWDGVGNLFFEYKPISWLTFKTSYSAAFNNAKQGLSWGAMTNTGVANGNLASAKINELEKFNYTWDNQFNIDYVYKDNHSFNFLGLQSINESRFETSFMSAAQMPFDTGIYNIGSGKQTTFNVGSYYDKSSLASFAARLNYAYKDKYLLTVSNRWDGSSKFAQGNKWGSFPSAALAWKISKENFLQNLDVISDLKLRTSFGYTGNNIISSYSTINKIDLQTYYDFNATIANGWVQSALSNPNLRWEKTREMNIGLDFGLLKNRITGTIDLYDRLSKDLLLKQKLVIENGFATYNNNIGSVSNKGIELALTTKNIKTNLISWETTFIFTKNTNKIKAIYDETSNDIGNNLFIGESIDAIYNYKFDGIWQANQSAEAIAFGQKEGQARVLDYNGDGKITTDDRFIIGNSNPEWTGSLTSNLKVGNFDLSISAITSQNALVYSKFHENFTNTDDRGRQKLDIVWYTPENSAGLPTQYTNDYPQPKNEGVYWNTNKVGYYKDASFIKVKNISFGYTFGQNILEKLKLKSLRIYSNVLNPIVITNYDGYDPEWAGADLGIGRVASITYQLGLSIKF